ncbi:hypothetical protein EVJ50_00885 [Synechococcus sp. RSCCF101]|nr:hypothetical protein EVJ50_00885 [Synechococcus sp. RSCCF101]
MDQLLPLNPAFGDGLSCPLPAWPMDVPSAGLTSWEHRREQERSRRCAPATALSWTELLGQQ